MVLKTIYDLVSSRVGLWLEQREHRVFEERKHPLRVKSRATLGLPKKRIYFFAKDVIGVRNPTPSLVCDYCHSVYKS